MKWFRKRHEPPVIVLHNVCEECKVHYEPLSLWDMSVNVIFAGYCKRCRDPKVALYLRRMVVTDWATKNWEKLEKRALKELAKEKVGLGNPKNVGDFGPHYHAAAQNAAQGQAHCALGSYAPIGVWNRVP